jgi:hypothetical protein
MLLLSSFGGGGDASDEAAEAELLWYSLLVAAVLSCDRLAALAARCGMAEVDKRRKEGERKKRWEAEMSEQDLNVYSCR